MGKKHASQYANFGSLPPMSVQQQICSMFELTERKLDNEQEYISCLQQQKRYLLQKMFI